MKLVTSEDIEGHEAATTRGMAEGAAAGLTFAGISHFFLRSKPYYRSLPVTIKFLGVVLCVAPAIAAQAERRGVQYDMEHNWEGAGKSELDWEEAEALKRWNSLSTKEKVTDWALQNRWRIFVAGWATSMGVSWVLLQRNKTQSFSQKLVQARVYAQAIALVGLLGAAGLSQMQPKEKKIAKLADHSWARLLEQQAKEAEEIKQAARQTA